jgi:hypothetical protein
VIPIRFTLDRVHAGDRREVVAGLAYDMQLGVSGSNRQAVLFNVRVAFGGTWLGADSVNPEVDGSLRIVQVNACRGSRSVRGRRFRVIT